ncbi:hypothetical protein LCGC14_3044110, partial [marine sediment metagenome]
MPTNARLPVVGAIACLGAAILLAITSLAPGQQTPPTKPSADPALNITDTGTVELHVQGADLRRVLQLLSTQSKTNIIASKEVQGTVTADLYGVTFTQALESVLQSAGFTYIQKGNFIYVMTEKQYTDWQESKRELLVKVFKLSYVTAADAKEFLTPLLGSNGSIAVTPAPAVGIASSATETGGISLAVEDMLLVRDYSENLEKMTKVLREIDVRPQQVLIAATILRATLTETNILGIDFNALAGVDFRSLSSTSTGVTSITPGAVPAEQLDQATSTIRTDFNAGLPNG